MIVGQLIPASRPKLSRAEILRIIKHRKPKTKTILIGIRGYYLDSMGKKGSNDRGSYDDAVILVRMDKNGIAEVSQFNANTDPSVYRKSIATLKSDNYKYVVGVHGLSKPEHRRYEALVQGEPVTVTRDGQVGEYKGRFGINIHKGGYGTTSSLGCQTIWPDQWSEFMHSVKVSLEKSGESTLTYVLLDEPARRKYIEKEGAK